ncbi:hypothetical protein SAMN06296386_101136 [Lachnospiraceae bacterium]|nr:hypothetical protein SAMN06296386_101136 [Lachnospiraceae bacterium]
MLGKLIKHEFKNTWMAMVLIYAITIFLGISGSIFFGILNSCDFLTEPWREFWNMAGFLGAVAALSALNMIVIIFLVVHYYRNLYSSQGYLSFTLPATATKVVSSRIIVSCIWILLFYVSVFISFTSAMLLMSQFPAFSDFCRAMREFFDELIKSSSSAIFIRNFTLAIFATMLSIIANLMQYFFCISIGQLWHKNKILGSVLCYLGTSIVLGVVIGFINFGSLLLTSFNGTESPNFFFYYMLKNALYSSVLILIFYFTSVFIANKKLNLD